MSYHRLKYPMKIGEKLLPKGTSCHGCSLSDVQKTFPRITGWKPDSEFAAIKFQETGPLIVVLKTQLE